MENPSKRAIDLAVRAGRIRQSPRTKLVHHHFIDTATDTIPFFENFCFAMALFRQRTVESILEGKEILERLLAFQIPEGNFPIYLHDFPRCYDPWMGLRIAPILIQIQRHFGAVMGAELKKKMAAALLELLKYAESRNRPPLWEHRFLKLQGIASDYSPKDPDEWFHWLLSEQLDSLKCERVIPYHPDLQALLGEEVQEKGEPRPTPLEWILAEQAGFSERLQKDHIAVLHAALLFPISEPKVLASSAFVLIPERPLLLWRGGCKLHSLSVPGGHLREGKIYFDLPEPPLIEKRDLIEAGLYCDISPETKLTICGKKGTVFPLGATVEIRTSMLMIELRFDLEAGEGDFCGQITRANRPAQTACKGELLYEAFDWRIAMRTLRRSPNCRIAVSLNIK
jgi:hypothetical protein